MGNVKFEDFSIKVKEAIASSINVALEECAGELESQVKRNSRVDTGKTRNSFRHVVDDEKHVATIGSDEENSIWEEFGTGEHAAETGHQGRLTPWSYKDEKGQWHFTHGKKPSRAFWNAYIIMKSKIINHIQNSLKGL